MRTGILPDGSGPTDAQDWSRWLFDRLAEGALWGVPRSGLIFQRKGDKLVLFERMPWMAEMEGTITPEQLREQQEAEFQSVKRHFEAAGIPVRREEVTR